MILFCFSSRTSKQYDIQYNRKRSGKMRLWPLLINMSLPKKAKPGSLKRKEKAERERKQGEGRQLLTHFFQKKGEHSSQLTQFKNS